MSGRYVPGLFRMNVVPAMVRLGDEAMKQHVSIILQVVLPCRLVGFPKVTLYPSCTSYALGRLKPGSLVCTGSGRTVCYHTRAAQNSDTHVRLYIRNDHRTQRHTFLLPPSSFILYLPRFRFLLGFVSFLEQDLLDEACFFLSEARLSPSLPIYYSL